MLDEKTLRDMEHRFDERYVRQDFCTRQTRENYERIEEVKIDMAKIKTRLDLIVAILGVIGAAVVGAVLKM